MKRFILALLLVFSLSIFFFFAVFSNASRSNPPKAKPKASVSIPVTLKIPKLGISTAVESVSMDSQGRMDVPKKVANVAWYQPGYRPGERGNSVLAGHLDDVEGDPAVFYNLEKLIPGDAILVKNELKQTYRFRVVAVQSYQVSEFPMDLVFGPSKNSRLNLITCQGEWSERENNYSKRLVVFSELASQPYY